MSSLQLLYAIPAISFWFVQIKKAGCTVLLVQKSILRDAYNDLSIHFLAKVNHIALPGFRAPGPDHECFPVVLFLCEFSVLEKPVLEKPPHQNGWLLLPPSPFARVADAMPSTPSGCKCMYISV